MSLMRLLSAGRSWVDGAKAESRYRMRSRYLLPKFGSANNPFAATKPSTEPVPADAQHETRRELTPAEIDAANLKETRKLPVIAANPLPSDEREGPSEATVISSKLSPRKERRNVFGQLASQFAGRCFSMLSGPVSWITRLNPWAKLPGKKVEAKPAIPRFGKAPVQGELSLDKVRVVRNDLTEADVEIVRAEPVSKLKTRPVVAREEAMELVESKRS